MTQELEDFRLSPEEEKVRDAIAGLPQVEASRGYRARLRREFSTGMWSPPRPEPVLPPPRWKVYLHHSPVPVALAALLLVAVLNRGPGWEVVGTSPGGSLRTDGASIPFAEREAVTGALSRGGRLTVAQGSEITWRNGDVLRVQAGEGTEMTLPSPPGRWFRKNLSGRVERGEARYLTEDGFLGRKLRIETPVGSTLVTGTLFSVVTDSSFTCVCVLEGTAWVGSTENTMEAIPPGMRKVMFGDSRPDVVLPIEPGHAHGLSRLLLDRGRPAP